MGGHYLPAIRQKAVLRAPRGRSARIELRTGLSAAPEALPDRLSAAYLVAVAARAVSDVGALLRRRSEPPTLTVDTEISFASAAARAAFADELSHAVTTLAAKYHAQEGSPHRAPRSGRSGSTP